MCSYLPVNWWVIDLLTHFRLQYCMFFGVAALLLGLMRRWRWLGIAFLLFCINAADVGPRLFTQPKAAPEQGTSLRLMTFNVNTLGDPIKAFTLVQNVQPDVLLLMEINSLWLTQLKPALDQLPYQVVRPRDDNFGIAMFSKYPMQGKVVSLGPIPLPSLHTFVNVAGQSLQVWGTHPPPPMGSAMTAMRDEQLAALSQHLHGQQMSILAGDLNATVYSRPLKALLDHTGLQPSSLGFGIKGTWPMDSTLLSIPIDFVLHSPDIVTSGHTVLWNTGSDHGAVVADLILPGSAPD